MRIVFSSASASLCLLGIVSSTALATPMQVLSGNGTPSSIAASHQQAAQKNIQFAQRQGGGAMRGSGVRRVMPRAAPAFRGRAAGMRAPTARVYRAPRIRLAPAYRYPRVTRTPVYRYPRVVRTPAHRYPRYRYRRPGFTYFYGGWFYPFAWWLTPQVTYTPRVYSGRCTYWHRQCVRNWGYRTPSYYGCMRYHRCQ